MNDTVGRIREALDAGLNTEALDLALQAPPDHTEIIEIHYLGALACSRMGAIDDAERWLRHVDRESIGDSPLAAEVWSLAGRIAKARYDAAPSTNASIAQHAQVAIDCYRRAFTIGGDAYPIVNAATLALISGDLALSRTLAAQGLTAPGSEQDPWHQASLGEASLLLDDIDAARRHYRLAHKLAGDRVGHIASMRRQLLLIGSEPALALLHDIPAPEVIAFSGHMIDHPDRTEPRFPAHLEGEVARVLRDTLSQCSPAIGYSQPACGADILFLETMQAAGMQTHVVLPFARQDFIAESIAIAGSDWIPRFEGVLERATRVVQATQEPFLEDAVLFQHAANLVQGMAFLRAAELSTEPLMLTLLDPASPTLVGGTAASVELWQARGGRVMNIDLARIRGTVHRAAPISACRAGAETSTARSLKTLLFADISGFSKMPEGQTPHFVGLFLQICATLLDSLEHPAVDVNTRGDALYLVFDRPDHAAECAIRLLREMEGIDYPSFGLADGTGVRVGLHTGPVYRVHDPVMDKPTFYGTHVNLAARLEPVVQVGHVFVTEAFAASLMASGDNRFRCHYIGEMPLAKQFGTSRLFRLDD